MSLSVAKAEGFTVLTVISDPESPCPPLCQIMKGLCCSPGCCSVSGRLRGVHRTSQWVLATLHIVVGLFHIGLGVILTERSSPYPFWLGTMFLLIGAVSILSDKFPSPCLVILNVILNLSGVGFAIASIILCSLDLGFVTMWGLCNDDYDPVDMTSPSPAQYDLMVRCLNAKDLALMAMQGIMGVLIVLSVLEMCVAIVSAVLGIKILNNKAEYKGLETKDATSNPAA
ncbi:transmembrane protein 176A-like [Brachionichthys hirsutus]|uniref:transmembrane protein 176A-like n=1 Tax=Brachionichthys hirsutus TaxID=412623 RepID=UPI0036047E7A